jgi:hypothetical protein
MASGRPNSAVACAAAAGLLLAATTALAQPMTRRAATIPALKAFPAFYNGQAVLLRAEIRQEGERWTLAEGEDTIPAFGRSDISGSGTLEVRGEVWDIGRMEPTDGRLAGKDLRSILGVEPTTSWPRPGELVVVNLTSAAAAPPLAAPSLRNVVLAPERYVEQKVIVTFCSTYRSGPRTRRSGSPAGSRRAEASPSMSTRGWTRGGGSRSPASSRPSAGWSGSSRTRSRRPLRRRRRRRSRSSRRCRLTRPKSSSARRPTKKPMSH